MKANYAGTAFGAGLVTNSRGFRGPEWPVEKPAGTFRVALIGCSHAFGFGVEFEQTMGDLLATRLRRRLQRAVEVIVELRRQVRWHRIDTTATTASQAAGVRRNG